MNQATYLLYILCVGFIRVYKWIELQFLKLLTPLGKRVGRFAFKKVGIVVHCPGDPKWTDTDSKNALSQCTQYDKLIHVKIHDNIFFPLVANGSSGAGGEAYMNKIWDICGTFEDLTEYNKRLMENKIFDYYYTWWNTALEWLELFAFNLQTRERAFQVGVVHYDLGNKLFERMLDPWMQYTCGYWRDAKDLNSAQINKMELIAKKLDLKPGMRVLDIGCGWGTLCKYLAEKYQVECVGVTIGERGVEYGQLACKGLPVDIRLLDYREVNEQFDRIVSVGMFEHVGYHNYREFFTVVRRCLKPNGIFLLHTIARNHTGKFPSGNESFTHKYIFPNGNLPCPSDITKATDKLFVIEDWHNFGQDYAKTVYCWRENFVKAWPELKQDYDERFYRMWTLYLSVAIAGFLSRRIHLYQIVLTKEGLQTDYRSIR